MTLNSENQDIIRNILDDALNKIYEDHGVYIACLTAEWLDVGTGDESKKLLTFLEIEAEL